MADETQLIIVASVNVNRAHLLARSLRTWDADIQNSGLNVGIRIFSEGWDANHICLDTLKHCKDWIVYTGDQSGSHIRGYNHILENNVAEKYLFTHGEILFSSNALINAYNAAQSGIYVSFKIAWLGEFTTTNLENYDWFPPENIEQLQLHIKDDDKLKTSFYFNTDVREPKTWETTTTWCMEHGTLQMLRPFPDFRSWGADDLYFATARKQLGIDTFTLNDPILFHQYHPREEGPKTWKEITDMAIEALNKRFFELYK